MESAYHANACMCCVYVCVYMYVCRCVCMCVCRYVCMYVCMYVCRCVYEKVLREQKIHTDLGGVDLVMLA